MVRKWSRIGVALALAFVVAGSGCRSNKGKGKTGLGSDQIGPTSTGTDIGLSERVEGEGQRVTDVTFENVLFSYDSYQIPPEEMGKIEAVAQFMKDNAAVRLECEGNCDERGSNEYNMSLGEHRSLAVRAQLVSLGVEAERIQTKSFGEERPVETGHSETAWKVNRRVEFALYR